MPERPDPARVVADADVLAADVLVGGHARAAMDLVRSHSWLTPIASDALVADARAVIAACTDDDLAEEWTALFEPLRAAVTHPRGDHPALASALHGRAAHVLSFDEGLRSAATGVALRPAVATSVKHPRAFVSTFDAESLYEHVVGGSYPGPDRDPRGPPTGAPSDRPGAAGGGDGTER